MIKDLFKLSILLVLVSSCGGNRDAEVIDEDQLGIITADVSSEETNLKSKAQFDDIKPGEADLYTRSFENAPPLIPHTTEGFFPIKIKNNICLTCHLPDKAKETGAVPLSETHFATLRPQPELVDGIYTLPEHDVLINEYIGKLNNQYFNCNQCHVPQSNVSVDIENLFTPEFREEFGLAKSNLQDKIDEGI